MKAHTANMPNAIESIGLGKYYVNMNITEIEVTIEGKKVHQFEMDQVEISGYPTYPAVVEALIRERYSVSDEIALLRQHTAKAEEFDNYNTFCEACKAMARTVFE